MAMMAVTTSNSISVNARYAVTRLQLGGLHVGRLINRLPNSRAMTR
jgi:hypothetical protein